MSSCSTNPSTADLLPRRPKYDKTKTCVKCKENQGSIVIRHAVYCKTCFFPLVSIKFRRTLDPCINDLGLGKRLGPNRKSLKAPGNLLIALSGGLGSTVMLDLVYTCYFKGKDSGISNEEDARKGGKDHPRNVRAWKRAIVCYVDQSEALPGGKDRTDRIRALVEKYKVFDFVPLRLEDAFNDSWWNVPSDGPRWDMDITDEGIPLKRSQTAPVTPASRLHAHLAALPSSSSLPNSVTTLTRILLLYTARRNDCSHVLLGTSMTSAGVGIIGSVAGGGDVSEYNNGEIWLPPDEYEGKPIHVSRPLREVGLKESTAWAWWCTLEVVGKERIDTGKGRAMGINALARAFILGLEKDYPSTVSTIVRTCAKVISKEQDFGDFEMANERCAMCQRATQIGISQRWKSQISITSLPSSLNVSSSEDVPPRLADHLCYPCHTTLTSSGGGSTKKKAKNAECVPLPVWTEARFK